MRVLSFRWLRRRWVSTPAIAQAQVTECGVASLAIILAHHGRFVSLEELRRATGVSRDGTSAQDLLRAARDQGLTAKIHRAEPERLAALGFPLIVHLDFIHFVVVEGMTATHVLVNDPAAGRCDIPREDFQERFTGIALTFAPPADFRPAGGPVRVGQALVRRLAPAWGTLALLALVGLLLAVPPVLFAVLRPERPSAPGSAPAAGAKATRK
jgi:ABC-type bacteriocin/lantibiotic exporter with double-glycine peptidase domain